MASNAKSSRVTSSRVGATTTVRTVAAHSVDDGLPRALAGDRDAWQAIVEQYTNLLWWIARSYRLDETTSADLVQTVWLQLVRHGDAILEPRRLKGWLATTARNEALRRFQMAARVVPADSFDQEPDRLAPELDEGLLDNELIASALVAFRTLDPEEQRLLELVCKVPPLSYAEIAALLGRTPGYIGPTRARCLEKLRAEMRAMGSL